MQSPMNLGFSDDRELRVWKPILGKLVIICCKSYVSNRSKFKTITHIVSDEFWENPNLDDISEDRRNWSDSEINVKSVDLYVLIVEFGYKSVIGM